MHWIYLSPHLDDAVYSCGGLIWEQVQAGHIVEVWTICAGDPPEGDLSPLARSLHQRWSLDRNAAAVRREEDRLACGQLGAAVRHFSIPDCIYRRDPNTGEPLYPGEEAIFGGLHPADQVLINRLVQQLQEEIPDSCQLSAPLGIGNHVDHDLVRKAAARLGRAVSYYPDYPYLREPDGQEILCHLAQSPEWDPIPRTLSDQAVKAWKSAAASYASQLSTFWESIRHLEQEVEKLAAENQGGILWKTVEED